MGTLTDADEIKALLREGIELLRAIAHQGQAGKASPLSATDRRQLHRIFVAVDGDIGAMFWTVRDLIGHAKEHPDIANALGPIDEGSAKRIGKLLSRANGLEIDSFRLRRGANVREGWLWCVERVSFTA